MSPKTRLMATSARRALVLGTLVLACTLVGGAASAAGEPGTSPTNSEPGTTSCPASNRPNQMTLVAGTPQTTTLNTAFTTGLQVALTNSNGCAVTGVAGVAVTFSAPTSGASGVFSGSASSSVTVGSDSSGAVTAPTFTANGTAGSYTVTVSSPYGTVSFSLTNTPAGIPAAITAISPVSLSARVTSRYAQPLAVKVLDANGNPVAGATINFTLDTGSASNCGATGTPSASFTGGSTQATATTNVSGVAISPSPTASSATGSFTATAAVSASSASSSSTGDEPNAPKTPAGYATAVSFALDNLPGNPAKLTSGVGSTQSTHAGTQFPIRLGVTVTDAHKNPVPDALVAFSPPTDGPSGRFTIHSRGRPHHYQRTSRHRVVDVKTDSCGIAVAPAFTANDQPGGYIVKATTKHAKPALFTLLNTYRLAP